MLRMNFFPPDCQKIYSKIYTVNILTNKYAESNHSLRKNYHFYEKLSLCDGLFSSPPESPEIARLLSPSAGKFSRKTRKTVAPAGETCYTIKA